MVFSDVLEIHPEAWLQENLGKKIVELYIKKSEEMSVKYSVFPAGLKR